MVLTAAERTAEIPPIRVPRVCQEADPAVAAVHGTACQIGMIAQDRIERDLILTDERTSAIVLMPIRAKRKEFPGGYDKNDRFSVKMLISSCTSSSYELDADASNALSNLGLSCEQRHQLIEVCLTGIGARRITETFCISLITENDSGVWLSLRPFPRKDRTVYPELTIILDKPTWQTRAGGSASKSRYIVYALDPGAVVSSQGSSLVPLPLMAASSVVDSTLLRDPAGG